MLKRFLLITLFSAPALAVPVISGGLSGNGGIFIPDIGFGATTTVGRFLIPNPADNIAAIATASGLTAAQLNALTPGPVRRAGIMTATFTGGILTDGIRFTASATTLTFNTAAAPVYGYFAALDDLTGANPTLFLPLNLTATAQDFFFLLPAAGNYQFSIGAVRNNPSPGFGLFATYSTTVNLSNLAGFGTPEIDPGTASLPLLFCSTLLLSLKPRKAATRVG